MQSKFSEISRDLGKRFLWPTSRLEAGVLKKLLAEGSLKPEERLTGFSGNSMATQEVRFKWTLPNWTSSLG